MYNNEFAQEFEQALGQEQEYASQETFEFSPEFMGETNGENYELNGEFELNETQEMELAHQLLEVSNEQELNMFLGKLIKAAGRAIGNFARSPIGRGLGNVLKTVAKKALPVLGGAAGTFFGGPLGGMLGSKLGSAASNLFELELEGLSPEDQEFEMARAYVRFANSASRRAAGLARNRPGTPSRVLLRTALTQAARQHAPGLLRTSQPMPRAANGRFMSTRPQRIVRPVVGPGFGGGGFSPATADPFDQDPGDTLDGGFDDDGQEYGLAAGGRATQGTWQRRGRTLVIQL